MTGWVFVYMDSGEVVQHLFSGSNSYDRNCERVRWQSVKTMRAYVNESLRDMVDLFFVLRLRNPFLKLLKHWNGKTLGQVNSYFFLAVYASMGNSGILLFL